MVLVLSGMLLIAHIPAIGQSFSVSRHFFFFDIGCYLFPCGCAASLKCHRVKTSPVSIVLFRCSLVPIPHRLSRHRRHSTCRPERPAVSERTDRLIGDVVRRRCTRLDARRHAVALAPRSSAADAHCGSSNGRTASAAHIRPDAERQRALGAAAPAAAELARAR